MVCHAWLNGAQFQLTPPLVLFGLITTVAAAGRHPGTTLLNDWANEVNFLSLDLPRWAHNGVPTAVSSRHKIDKGIPDTRSTVTRHPFFPSLLRLSLEALHGWYIRLEFRLTTLYQYMTASPCNGKNDLTFSFYSPGPTLQVPDIGAQALAVLLYPAHCSC
ncbi:hypothetical protein QBC35DRAFT_107691 [Podospora australis]|uniref:Uncharacterized protein n=1 Tax=Podospora australis TaxID=1536484 RepID=A0AAN7AND0_9PEZI|nr:hypothetical protein QBC35DRAFT_107691 [Podospora australis]